MSVQQDLRAFRLKAYAMSPVFGANIDHLIMQGMGLAGYEPGGMGGMGLLDIPEPGASIFYDPTLVDTTVVTSGDTGIAAMLGSIAGGIQSAATAANLSIKNYFDAVTSVNQMAKASQAGLTVDQYTAAHNAQFTAGQINATTGKLAGIPVWALLAGGAGLILLLNRR
jgi:hypothetical protein